MFPEQVLGDLRIQPRGLMIRLDCFLVLQGLLANFVVKVGLLDFIVFDLVVVQELGVFFQCPIIHEHGLVGLRDQSLFGTDIVPDFSHSISE